MARDLFTAFVGLVSARNEAVANDCLQALEAALQKGGASGTTS
jgi:hypothetical protein